jgi:hypothetical protein
MRSPQKAMTAALGCGGSLPPSPPRMGALNKGGRHDDDQTQRKRPAAVHRHENWYGHGLNCNVPYTDGAKFVAE